MVEAPRFDRGARVVCAVVAGLLLFTRGDESPSEVAILASAWLVLVVGLSIRGRARSAAFVAAALVAAAGWTVHPAVWLRGLMLLAMAWAVRVLARSNDASESRGIEVVGTAVAVLAPVVLMSVVIALGGPGASLVRAELVDALPKYGPGRSALAASAFAAWASFWISSGELAESGRVDRAVGATVLGGLGVLAFLRARWILSTLFFPTELQWSEAPMLLDAWKLELGRPLYGPVADCNSYSYSPLVDLVHRAVLSPFGKNLSLTANRSLGLVWQGISVVVLAWALSRPDGSRTRASVLVLSGALALVVTSSFLAPILHPDHLTMVGFCLAIALVVSESRIPKRVFEAGLLAVPVFATTAKLTGAGVGLGLLLGFIRPMRRREVALVAAGGALALSTVPLFDATLGPFTTFAIALQASHPVRWSEAWTAFVAPEGRAFLASLAALGFSAGMIHGRFGDVLASESRTRWSSAVSDGVRLAILTSGFLLPSLVAFLKVGGRSNSLVPMAIGSAAILVRLGTAASGSVRALILVPAGFSLLLTVVKPEVAISESDRDAAERRLAETVALVRQERALGGETLLYDGTIAWILSGARSVPLDRWQTVQELVLGRHPEVAAFYDRLRRGYYRSVILGRQVLSTRYSRDADLLRAVLADHFRQMTPERLDDEGQPLVFHYSGPPLRE